MSRGRLQGLARAGLGVLVSLVCLFLVVRGVDLGRTWDVLRGAHPAWVGLAVVALAGDVLLRGVRWQRLIASIHRVAFPRLLAYMLVGYLANNVLPARLGELVRSHYLGDREGISRTTTLGTVVVERVVDIAVLVGIAALAIFVLHVRGIAELMVVRVARVRHFWIVAESGVRRYGLP